jgi:hypothetical protein
MARVFRMAKASESDDDTQTVMALGLRDALRRPGNRSWGHDMSVALCGGKLSKASQVALHGIEFEIGRSADR